MSPRAAAIALGLLAAVGCTKILGIDYQYEGTGGGSTGTGSGSTGSGAACGSFVWDPQASCQACMEKECCSELRACDKGTPCAQLVACVDACDPDGGSGAGGASADGGDESCLAACVNTDTNQNDSSGGDALYALTECFGGSCQAQANCSFPICAADFTWSFRECADCLGGNAGCCAAFTACGNDEVCGDCVAEVSTAGCSTNMNYAAANTCLTTTCGPVCEDSICGSEQFAFTSPRCNYCLTQSCCDPFNACIADTSSLCYMCISSQTTTGCDTDMLYSAYTACYDQFCEVDCDGFL